MTPPLPGEQPLECRDRTGLFIPPRVRNAGRSGSRLNTVSHARNGTETKRPELVGAAHVFLERCRDVPQ
jgi:hypothetical protein